MAVSLMLSTKWQKVIRMGEKSISNGNGVTLAYSRLIGANWSTLWVLFVVCLSGMLSRIKEF